MKALVGSTRRWGRASGLLGASLCGAALALLPAGCGDPPLEAQTPSAQGLSPWADRARVVFDDNIDPAAVGYTMDAPSARADRYLRERAQTAELVARLRVQTVTIDTVGDENTYHLGVQVGSPTLAPNPKIAERTLELTFKPNSPAFGIAKALDQRMQGVTFIGFVSRFASPDGSEVELHWHMCPDTQDVADAVKEAEALAAAQGH